MTRTLFFCLLFGIFCNQSFASNFDEQEKSAQFQPKRVRTDPIALPICCPLSPRTPPRPSLRGAISVCTPLQENYSPGTKFLQQTVLGFHQMVAENILSATRNFSSAKLELIALKEAFGRHGGFYLFSPLFHNTGKYKPYTQEFALILYDVHTVKELGRLGFLRTPGEIRLDYLEEKLEEQDALAEQAREVAKENLKPIVHHTTPLTDERYQQFLKSKIQYAKALQTKIKPVDVQRLFNEHLSPSFDAFHIQETIVYICMEMFINFQYDSISQLKSNMDRLKLGNNPRFTKDSGDMQSAEIHHIFELDTSPLVYLRPEDHDPSMHPLKPKISHIDRAEFGKQRIAINKELYVCLQAKYSSILETRSSSTNS